MHVGVEGYGTCNCTWVWKDTGVCNCTRVWMDMGMCDCTRVWKDTGVQLHEGMEGHRGV